MRETLGHLLGCSNLRPFGLLYLTYYKMETFRTLAKNQLVFKNGCNRLFVSYDCKIANYNTKTGRFTFYTDKRGNVYAFSSRTTQKYLRDFISYDTDATYTKREQILKAIEYHQIETEATEGNSYTKKIYA